MKLTKNFSLSELTRSVKATKLGIKEQFTPSEEVIDNLTTLCQNVLQPIRDELKAPLTITSGYRCSRLNKEIGGSKTSQHVKGEAADIVSLDENGAVNNSFLLDLILSLWFTKKIEFDQLIIEFPDEDGNPEWLHISYSISRNRNEILKAEKIGGKTVYTKLIK